MVPVTKASTEFDSKNSMIAWVSASEPAAAPGKLFEHGFDSSFESHEL